MAQHDHDGRRRIAASMTLPGSASLGAFQAGALAAIGVARASLYEHDVAFDVGAIGGSSAGSVVAALFAHGLTTGRDLPGLLRDAWVESVDVELMRRGRSDAPLTFDDVRDKIHKLLVERCPPDDRLRAETPVVLLVGLTSLRGFRTPVEGAAAEFEGIDYTDVYRAVLHPDDGTERLFEIEPPDRPGIVDAVLASASHPLAFRPRALDRPRADTAGPEAEGGRRTVWYTDGGLVESEPIGRVLDEMNRAELPDGVQRVHLIVDPRSTGPTGTTIWDDPEEEPSWMDGLRRSVSITPTQALHDDLRRAAATNLRIRTFEDELVPRLREQGGDELVDDVRAWSGLEDKHDVCLEVVNPRRVDAEDGVRKLLTGDFAATFGGFLEERVRASDFALGWVSVEEWLPAACERWGLDDLGEVIAGEVHDAWPADWDRTVLTGDGISQLDLAGRLRLAGLAARFSRRLVGNAFPSIR